jgi:hypothetical protein
LEVINLKTPLVIPQPAQAKQHLFWFRGKKINDSTLVTVKGTVVQHRKKKNQLIIQPDPKNDIFKKIDKQLALNETRKASYIHKMAGTRNSFFFYPGIKKSVEEMDRLQKLYQTMTRNVIDLGSIDSEEDEEGLNSGKGGFHFKKRHSIPEKIMAVYNEVQYMMQNKEGLDFPEPPTRSLDACFNCDEEKQDNYWKRVEEWNAEFLKFEKKLNDKAILVIRGLDSLEDPQVPGMIDQMREAIATSTTRFKHKLELLETKYSNSVFVIPLLIQECIMLLRQQSFLEAEDEVNEQQVIKKLLGYIDKIILYIREEMNRRNYNVGFNLPMILGLYTQKLFITEDGDDLANLYQHLEELDHFNRFKMDLNMYSSVTMKDLTATALVETSSNFYVQLGMVDCKYQFFIWGVDHLSNNEKEKRIPLFSRGGVKTQLEEDEKYHTHNYSGPEEMMAVFPTFDIDFCTDAIPDTVYISIVRYVSDDVSAEARKIPKAYTIDLMGYINFLVLNPEGAEASVDENLQIGMEMMEIHSTPQIPFPTGYPELDAIQDNYQKVIEMRKLQKRQIATSFGKHSAILFDAQNYAKEIVNKSVDTRKSNDDATVEGVIKLKIQHDPVPYKRPQDKN